MFRISRLTDYATVVMTALAEDPATVISAVELAERVRLEPTTVSKLLKQLGQAQLVESFRGANGGYRLARAPRAITVTRAPMESPDLRSASINCSSSATRSGSGQKNGLLSTASQLLPPSSERWIIWPNQPLDCEA